MTPIRNDRGRFRSPHANVYWAGVTANQVLPHTGPPGTDPLAESIPRNDIGLYEYDDLGG